MGAPAAHPWRSVAGGVAVRVHLTPRSSRDSVDGVSDLPDGPALKARVRAVPEDGKANAALEALLADWLRLGNRSVAVTGGTTSRTKSVTLSGPSGALTAALEQRLATLKATLPKD